MTDIFILHSEIWYVFGIALIIVDLAVGFSFFILSFGVGAVATGIIIGVIPGTYFAQYIHIDTPIMALFYFGVLSLVALAPIKYVVYLRLKKEKDINEY